MAFLNSGPDTLANLTIIFASKVVIDCLVYTASAAVTGASVVSTANGKCGRVDGIVKA